MNKLPGGGSFEMRDRLLVLHDAQGNWLYGITPEEWYKGVVDALKAERQFVEELHTFYHETGMCYGDSHAEFVQREQVASRHLENVLSVAATPMERLDALQEFYDAAKAKDEVSENPYDWEYQLSLYREHMDKKSAAERRLRLATEKVAATQEK